MDLNQTYDVAVIGGGPGGVCAALAASGYGMNVLLVERYGFLGGMATAGLVNPFMAYSTAGKSFALRHLIRFFSVWLWKMPWMLRGVYLTMKYLNRCLIKWYLGRNRSAPATVFLMLRQAGTDRFCPGI